MRIDFYVKWQTMMTCIAPKYVHKQLIIIHVVCCDAMTFLFIVRCYTTECWNKTQENTHRVNQMNTQSSNKMNEQSNNNNKSYPHTYPYPYSIQHTAYTQRDLQSTTIENIIYQLNKAKSSWKLKTYTCYCSCKKTSYNLCVFTGPSSFDIETNRIEFIAQKCSFM